MTTEEVGRKLVGLCQQGKNVEAVNSLFAEGAVSEEAAESPDFPRVTKGREAIRAKNEKWGAVNEIHGQEVAGPYPNGDDFAVVFKLDFTPKDGAFKGQRISMQEVGLYSVEDGKVVRERFFYAMG
jgi:ketosteroid isomerase-like protein